MIYIAQILNEKFVKIGFSNNVDVTQRISELQTGNPYEILPVLTIEGTLRQEQTLHLCLNKAFARIRIPLPPNEWYPCRNPFMKELRYGFDNGLYVVERKNPSIKQPSPKREGDIFTPNFKWPNK